MYATSIFAFTLFGMICVLIEPSFQKSTRKVMVCMLSVLFSILIACRPLTVPDTWIYVDLYKQLDVFYIYDIGDDLKVANNLGSFEFGYVIFCQIAKIFFGQKYELFLFIIPIINISLIMFAFKKIIYHVDTEYSKINNRQKLTLGFILMLCLYTSYFGLVYNGIILRASFAISLTLCSLAMHLDKKYLKMIVLWVIAFAFHKTSVLGMLVVGIFHIIPVFKRIHYFIIWLIIGLLAIFRISDSLIGLTISLLQMFLTELSFLSSYEEYLSDYITQIRFGYKNIFFYLIGLILLFWKIDSNIYYKLLNIYYVGLIIVVLTYNISVAYRITDFITIYMIMGLYILYKYSKAPRILKWMLMIGIVSINNVLALIIFKVFFDFIPSKI